MALTAEERALYTTRLTEAESALHQIMLGNGARVYVDQNGERVEYFAANASRLRAYIAELKLLLGRTTVQGPLNYWM